MKVVWFAEIKWDYLRTRKQQIIGRRPSFVELLYLEPYVRGKSNSPALRKEEGVYLAMIPFLKSPPNAIWRGILSRGLARTGVDAMAKRISAGKIAEAGFASKETVFITSNIYAVRSAIGLSRKMLIYDCNDAHDAFPGMPGWSEDYFNLTCREADAVVASSRMLLEKVQSIRGNDECFLIGNGVDFAKFIMSREDMIDRAKAKRFTLGYIGALAPWVDFDLLGELAVAHPKWHIVLTGPVLLGAQGELDRVLKNKNVLYSRPIPYGEVPSLLKRFNVGIIPFRYNELTRGVNPNKLYEYLASGLPVVTTSFSSEVKSCGDVVFAANSPRDFMSSCELLAETAGDSRSVEETASKARDIARENDWSSKAEEFWNVVNNLVTD